MIFVILKWRGFCLAILFYKIDFVYLHCMINKEDRVKLFVNELNYIHDPKIREFAKRLIEDAPEYFFHVPASSSGKYHPPFDLGEGGLMRHTRCVAYFAKSFAISHMVDSRTSDMLVMSAIAHDIKKQGDGLGQHTVAEHPALAADYVAELAKEMPDVFTEEELQTILKGVKSHMGQWGAKDGLPVPSTPFDFMLHDADYVASRREILDFDFAPVDGVVIEPEPVNENVSSDDPGKYILTFGKHSGKTLEEVEPTGYLDWMVKQEDFKNVEAQEAARKYLEYKKNPVKKAPPIPEVKANTIDDLPF